MSVVADWLKKIKSHLRDAQISNYDIEAWLLLEWATGRTRLDLVTHLQSPIEDWQRQKLDDALCRRLKGEPTYRIIGVREFYGIPFALSSETLEPRNDSETIVDCLIGVLNKIIRNKAEAQFLDLGTGSGAIAVAALVNVPQATAVGVDIAQQALDTAMFNADNAGVGKRFLPLKSDWFSHVTGKFDLIVSNPPYIPRHEIAQLAPEVRHYDPIRALDGGIDGLDCYRLLAAHAHHYLKPDGMVIVEIGFQQAHDVQSIFVQHGFRLQDKRPDLNGIPRALTFAV